MPTAYEQREAELERLRRLFRDYAAEYGLCKRWGKEGDLTSWERARMRICEREMAILDVVGQALKDGDLAHGDVKFKRKELRERMMEWENIAKQCSVKLRFGERVGSAIKVYIDDEEYVVNTHWNSFGFVPKAGMDIKALIRIKGERVLMKEVR